MSVKQRWTECTHVVMHTGEFCPSPVASTEQLPEHETAVCVECDWTGVMIQGERCQCAQCGFVWRWPLYAGMGLD